MGKRTLKVRSAFGVLFLFVYASIRGDPPSFFLPFCMKDSEGFFRFPISFPKKDSSSVLRQKKRENVSRGSDHSVLSGAESPQEGKTVDDEKIGRVQPFKDGETDAARSDGKGLHEKSLSSFFSGIFKTQTTGTSIIKGKSLSVQAEESCPVCFPIVRRTISSKRRRNGRGIPIFRHGRSVPAGRFPEKEGRLPSDQNVSGRG